MLIVVALVVLVGWMTWFLSADRPAQKEPLSIVRAGTTAGTTATFSPLEDPGEQRIAPSPATPSHPVVEPKQPQSVPEVVRFLRAALPKQFAALSPEEAEAITSLDLRGASITDADLIQLAALPNLASLSLRGTAITDTGLAYLRNIPKLTSIDLRATKVTGMGLLTLPTERIEALHLTDTQVKGEDLHWLPPMPKLQVLKLNRLTVDDTALASLPSMPSLSHVELDGTKISDDGLRRLLQKNPGIKRVELRETPVSKETIAELIQLHPGIELVQDSPDPRVGMNR
jgi:Leucine-rich repeat (LRR) protein